MKSLDRGLRLCAIYISLKEYLEVLACVNAMEASVCSRRYGWWWDLSVQGGCDLARRPRSYLPDRKCIPDNLPLYVIVCCLGPDCRDISALQRFLKGFQVRIMKENLEGWRETYHKSIFYCLLPWARPWDIGAKFSSANRLTNMFLDLIRV